MATLYAVSTDFPKGILYRQENYDFKRWDPRLKKWVDDEDAAGYFLGFNPGKKIPEEEAMKIVEGNA